MSDHYLRKQGLECYNVKPSRKGTNLALPNLKSTSQTDIDNFVEKSYDVMFNNFWDTLKKDKLDISQSIIGKVEL